MIKSLIPNLLTSINLTCGILSIIIMDPLWSPTLILFGAIADVFDGAIARFLGVDGDFGLQLDSLADHVTFGIAPAMIFSVLYLENIYIISFVTIFSGLCAAWRLAKFNTLESSTGFRGLPSPAHGLFVTGLLFGLLYQDTWLTHFSENDINGPSVAHGWPYYITIIAIITTSLLMVSKFKFTSLKGIKSERKTQIILGIVIIATALTALLFPAHFIWVGIGIYTITSLIGNLTPIAHDV